MAWGVKAYHASYIYMTYQNEFICMHNDTDHYAIDYLYSWINTTSGESPNCLWLFMQKILINTAVKLRVMLITILGLNTSFYDELSLGACIFGTVSSWNLVAECLREKHWLISPRTKWPPYHRRNFQLHFPEWKCMNFGYDFTNIFF